MVLVFIGPGSVNGIGSGIGYGSVTDRLRFDSIDKLSVEGGKGTLTIATKVYMKKLIVSIKINYARPLADLFAWFSWKFTLDFHP